MQLSAEERREDAAGCPVLIFSGDQNFVDHHRRTLLSLGFVPIAAASAESALSVLRLLVIALVVVDEDEGLCESRMILKRAREIQQHAPVLVVSQRADPESRHQALAMGAAEYLEHPVLPDDVVHAFFPRDSRLRVHARVHQGAGED